MDTLAPPTYVSVTSIAYSGSTLFSHLLGSHPEIATVGELSGPPPGTVKEVHRCSCGALTLQCPFLMEIQRRLAAKGESFSILDEPHAWRLSDNRYIHHALARVVPKTLDGFQSLLLRHLPPFGGRFANHVRRNASVITEICTYFGANTYVDKGMEQAQWIRRQSGMDVYIVHLVRDGRGQTWSRIKRGSTMMSAARGLVRFDYQAVAMERLVGKRRYLRLRYEDLCVDTEAQLARVAKFIGVDPNVFPPDYSREDMHIFGNPMRLTYNGSISLDETWKEKLSPDDLALFERIAGRRNRLFGYA